MQKKKQEIVYTNLTVTIRCFGNRCPYDLTVDVAQEIDNVTFDPTDTFFVRTHRFRFRIRVDFCIGRFLEPFKQQKQQFLKVQDLMCQHLILEMEEK